MEAKSVAEILGVTYMTRWARVARGTVAATVSLFIAAFWHSLAGGPLPGSAGIALCLVFSVIACTALAGRRMPRTRLVASVVASQALYHGLFGSLGSASVAAPGALGHVHNAPIDFNAVPIHVHAAQNMVLAHIGAATVTIVVLAFGERSMAATVRVARKAILSLFPAFADAPGTRWPAPLCPTESKRRLRLLSRIDFSGLRYRGPPPRAAF